MVCFKYWKEKDYKMEIFVFLLEHGLAHVKIIKKKLNFSPFHVEGISSFLHQFWTQLKKCFMKDTGNQIIDYHDDVYIYAPIVLF